MTCKYEQAIRDAIHILKDYQGLAKIYVNERRAEANIDDYLEVVRILKAPFPEVTNAADHG